MAENDRFDKFNKKNGRPAKEETEKKTKKVLLSMTEKQHQKMLKYQKMFGKNTLTSAIEFLIERGEEKVLEELESFREK